MTPSVNSRCRSVGWCSCCAARGCARFRRSERHDMEWESKDTAQYPNIISLHSLLSRACSPSRFAQCATLLIVAPWEAIFGLMSQISRILEAIEQDDPQAASQLLPLVYNELRRLAARKLA